MLVYSILPLARRGRCAMLVSLIGARCGMPYAAWPSSCSGAMYWMVLAALLVCVLGSHGVNWLVMPPWLSSPSFARFVAFSEMMLPQFFSLWVRLQPQAAVPAWAVSRCDDGHGAAAGCAQPLSVRS